MLIIKLMLFNIFFSVFNFIYNGKNLTERNKINYFSTLAATECTFTFFGNYLSLLSQSNYILFPEFSKIYVKN